MNYEKQNQVSETVKIQYYTINHKKSIIAKHLVDVVAVHIYALVTGQCQTLTIRRSAHFSLH